MDLSLEATPISSAPLNLLPNFVRVTVMGFCRKGKGCYHFIVVGYVESENILRFAIFKANKEFLSLNRIRHLAFFNILSFNLSLRLKSSKVSCSDLRESIEHKNIYSILIF